MRNNLDMFGAQPNHPFAEIVLREYAVDLPWTNENVTWSEIACKMQPRQKWSSESRSISSWEQTSFKTLLTSFVSSIKSMTKEAKTATNPVTKLIMAMPT